MYFTYLETWKKDALGKYSVALIGVIKLLENGCQKIWRGKWNSHAEYV